MDPLSIGIGVFVFVVVYVGGTRIMRQLEARKATKEALRRLNITDRAKRRDYTGPRFNVHGREMD